MDIKLQAELRKSGEKVENGYIAAVVYGPGTENKSLKVKQAELEKAFTAAGESNLISLNIVGGTEAKVLIKDIQRDPLKNYLSHVDFYQVDMKHKIHTAIPLLFVGESKAIKELGGVLIKNLHEVEVKCLPNDLVDHIEVDLAALVEIHDAIFVRDLKVAPSMEILADADSSVVTVIEPRTEAAAAVETPVATPAATDKKAAPATPATPAKK